MFFKLFNYKQQADKNKVKVIKKDVKRFKKLCLTEFKKNIKIGVDTSYVDFCLKVSFAFEEETSEIVLSELRKDYTDIGFSFVFRHCNNSYKGIKMVALEKE